MKCPRWRDLFLSCRRSASSDCSAYRSARESNRWLQQRGNSRGRRVSAQPDTRRRLTKSFIFGRARPKSGARAASSPSLSSRHRWPGSRRELATVATRSSLAVRTRMSDDRSRVRSRRVGRPTRGRCGRDPDCRGDSQRTRCPPLLRVRTLNAAALGNESAFRQETDRSGSARSTQPVAALGSGPADRDHRETRRRGSEIFCASPSVTLDARGTSDSRKTGSCHASSPSVGSRATATA